MKINYISDLHLEFDDYTHTNTENADYLFLAGDIAPIIRYKDKIEAFLASVSPQYKKVLWIPGNHEYYGAELFESNKIAREICKDTNVRFLHNETVLLEDYTVIAGPLWTNLSDEFDSQIAKRAMNDYRLITVFGLIGDFEKEYGLQSGNLTPQFTTELHLNMVKMIENCNSDKIIVLGHHLPSYKSVDPNYEGDRLNCAFASHLDYLFAKVKFWIHGHTHCSVEYEKNGCTVLCNPKGYRKENVLGFNPAATFTT